jgi:hypothetical protein
MAFLEARSRFRAYHSVLKAFLSVMSLTWLLAVARGGDVLSIAAPDVLHLFLYTTGISGRRKKRPELFNN